MEKLNSIRIIVLNIKTEIQNIEKSKRYEIFLKFEIFFSLLSIILDTFFQLDLTS